MPSYDFGFNFKWWKLALIFNQRYGKKVPVYADVYSSMGALYDYDEYRVINADGPGHGMSFTHAGLSYSDELGSWNIGITAYFDLNKSSQYSIIGDGVEGTAVGDSVKNYSPFQVMNWSEYSVGGLALANYNYSKLGRLGKGNILLGMQMEYMHLYGAEGLIGDNFTDITMHWPTNPVQLGSESMYSPLIQLKHYFNDKWVLNAGARYDIKKRVNGDVKTSLSPRISLIYMPNDKMSIKLNYGRSFVDAPYFYRYNQSPSYKGPEDMAPEDMEAIQASFDYQPIQGLSYNTVVFYNNLTGLIYRDQTAEGNEPRYINAGKLRTIGWENSLQYRQSRWMANFNLTYQSALEGENYNLSGRRIYNVPNWFMNMTLNGHIIKRTNHNLEAYATGRLTGKQLSPIDHVLIGGHTVVDMDNQLPAVFTMNAGVRYRYRNVELGLATYNLFNKTYYQGGSTFVPYIQQGFSLLGTIRYVFNKD